MVVGRPRQFDRDEALEKAMEAFWAKGYAACSVQDLLDAMGINRGSMYDTFGDKHSMFISALEHYVDGFGKRFESVLHAPGSPLGNVRTMLDQVIAMATDREQRGCMITNSAIELAPRDPVVAQALKRVFSRFGDLVRETLDRGVEAGELSADSDTRSQTRFVLATIHGLIVMGKTAHSRKELNEVVDVAMFALN